MDHRVSILMYMELLLCLFLLWREGLLRLRAPRMTAFLALAAVFLLRFFCLDYQTLDYQDWIACWVQALRDAGPWKGLGQEIWSCNYNVPYLYILALISKSDIFDLYLVKLTSIFFDVVLAWGVMRIVSLYTDGVWRRLAAFLGTLWLPTVILNGAVWGQCDSIYAAFAVLSLYLVLRGRPVWSMVCMAVSLSFKLQAIFLMPVFLVFIFAKKLKVWQLAVFPAAYIVTLLPAVLAGRSFSELLLFYLNNVMSVGDGLNYNSPSIYALFDFRGISVEYAARIGIILAFGLCALLYLWALLHYGGLGDRALLGFAVLFCIGVPLLLPHMHDRYFFLADVLTLALALSAPKFFALPVLTSAASLLSYYAYLKMKFLIPLRWGCIALLACMALLLVYTFFTLRDPSPRLKKSS